MRLLLKLIFIVLPVAAVVGLLRMCEGGAGDRWVDRVYAIDPNAVLAIDRDDLIVVAPSRGRGIDVGEYALSFRRALATEYGELLGTDVDRAMVVVVFSHVEMVAAYGGKGEREGTGLTAHAAGYTDPRRNAIFLPPEVGRSVVRHELVHLLMSLETVGRVQISPWLSEGLATYLESFNPPEPVTTTGQQKALLRLVLRNRGVDVMRLLELDVYRDFLENDAARNYLESRALVAFLMEVEGRAKMQNLISLERNSQASAMRRFVEVYGEPGRVADALRAWLGAR